jgi:hypothetical protein
VDIIHCSALSASSRAGALPVRFATGFAVSASLLPPVEAHLPAAHGYVMRKAAEVLLSDLSQPAMARPLTRSIGRISRKSIAPRDRSVAEASDRDNP